jgi:hypothetical protein
MSLPFVGPSYTLSDPKQAIDRAINLHLASMETVGKAPFVMDSVPGLILRWSLGAEIRGAVKVGARAFVVAGSTLYEVFSDYTSANRGTLMTNTGAVDMAYGLFQLVVVDGPYGYVLTTDSNVFAQITSPAFYGSSRVAFLDNYFLFIRPDTQQLYITAINDATTLDALDFISAESAPDNITALVVDHEEAWTLGELTVEIFGDTGGVDFPFARRGGATMEVGCIAAHSARKIDSTVFWIGQDVNGTGMVYRAQVYQPQRISTRAVEKALRSSTDLSAAVAFCYQQDGVTFYCINAPGLNSTWCYELATGSWHERCDLGADGQYIAHRGTCHLAAFNAHYLGAADGSVYELDRDTYTNAGDTLKRERISPHYAKPGRPFQFFPAFYLDCTTGEAPQGVTPEVELSWSDDSGATWSDSILRSIGAVGERLARVLWTRLGRSRDRVWRVTFSGNAPFSIIDAGPDNSQGTG